MLHSSSTLDADDVNILLEDRLIRVLHDVYVVARVSEGVLCCNALSSFLDDSSFP